jgi:DNA-binding MarR family transcriptional regulator
MANNETTPETIREQLFQLFREFSTQTVMFHHALAEQLGLGPADHKYLYIILSSGGITAKQLAECTGLTSGSITSLIDRLEKAGFVERKRQSRDRRVITIVPKQDKAQQMIDPLFESLQKSVEQLCSQYNEEELYFLTHFFKDGIEIMQERTADYKS